MSRSHTVAIAAALLVVSACTPSKADVKTDIVGRWESKSFHDLRSGNGPLFAEFSADGILEISAAHPAYDHPKWLLLENGDLQIKYRSQTIRCTPSIEGNQLTLTNPGCMQGWEMFGKSVTLEKQ